MAAMNRYSGRSSIMPKYSKQDLKYAAEFREGIHKEALAIVRKTRPNATDVIDRHPVEDYFQESWEYPGRWYTVVAVPNGYKSRRDLVDAIVRDTLSGSAPEKEDTSGQKPGEKAISDISEGTIIKDERFDQLISKYPDLVPDYYIVKVGQYRGYESHRLVLKTAFNELGDEWEGDPGRAEGRNITALELLSSDKQPGKLSYRTAFLSPPYENSYTENDFDLVNSALFPNGTDSLEIYEWSTDWSDYFDDGHEWWGTLCLTVYDKTLDRFVVILASATD